MIQAGDLVFIWNPKKGDNFLIKVTPGMSQGTHFGQIKHTELMEQNWLYREFVAEHVRRPTG